MAQTIPFRQATIERAEILVTDQLTQSSTAQRLERIIEGAGYIYGLVLRVVASTSDNTADVAVQEDAPWSVLDTVVLRDVNGELINVSGYDLYLANLANKQGTAFWDGAGGSQAPDSMVYAAPVTGSSANGGSYTFTLRVPVGTNRRDLVGILGNQDRAQKYMLRTDIAPLSAVYSTSPTNPPSITLERIYENYAVPLPQSPAGLQQEVFPPSFGTLHYLTATVSEAAPLGGSTVNHFLRRIGNTVRWIALVFRSNGSRNAAHTNAPTNIRLKLGDDTIFNEPYWYRRALMYERYGFKFPDGVLLYEALHDFSGEAGFELGNDYFHTQALVNAQFIISYPSGFGTTGNSLRMITDDLQLVAVGT